MAKEFTFVRKIKKGTFIDIMGAREVDFKNNKDLKPVKQTENKIVFKKEAVYVDGGNNKSSFLIFTLSKTAREFNVSVDEVLLFLYLEELGLFNKQIDVLGKFYYLGKYLELEYIREDYSHNKKKLYKLSKEGNAIVGYFYETSKDNTKIMSKNRSVSTNLEKRVDSALDNYFR